jgi:hypothetical protein
MTAARVLHDAVWCADEVLAPGGLADGIVDSPGLLVDVGPTVVEVQHDSTVAYLLAVSYERLRTTACQRPL